MTARFAASLHLLPVLILASCATGPAVPEAPAEGLFAPMYEATRTDAVGVRAFYRSGHYLDVDEYNSMIIEDVRVQPAERDAELSRLAGEFGEELRQRNSLFHRAPTPGPRTLRIVSELSRTVDPEGRDAIRARLMVMDSRPELERFIFGFEGTTVPDKAREAFIRWTTLLYDKASGTLDHA